MLDRLKPLLGHQIHASDGLIGTLDDFYIDDDQWIMRYLIVDTGTLLRRHKVLISPTAIDGIDWDGKTISLQHSMEQISCSPNIDVDKPLSRRIEADLLKYYGWVSHCPEPSTGPALAGDAPLCSMRNMCTYGVMAVDDRVGAIEDFIVDHNGWPIVLAILDTRHYLLAHHAVIPARRLKGVRGEDREIDIDMNKADVSASPQFDPALQLDDYVTILP